MSNILTFIIPVRHQENADNWEVIKNHLTDTIKSISNQDCEDWQAIIVANHGADLPNCPPNFQIKRVDFPPNRKLKKGSAPIEEVYDAFRIDKGRRVLAGLLHAKTMGHIMIVDDDDFVSRRLTTFIRDNKKCNGFYIESGYIWGEGGSWLFNYDGNFSKLCGTSHIIRADLYELPDSFESASDNYVRSMLGSHIFIQNYLKTCNTPLEPLPFIGAVYRVGGAENHSQSNGMLFDYFLQKWLWRKPIKQIKRLARLKRIDLGIMNEFFGSTTHLDWTKKS